MTYQECDICRKRMSDTRIKIFRGLEIFSVNPCILDKQMVDLCPECYKKIDKFLDELKSENVNEKSDEKN